MVNTRHLMVVMAFLSVSFCYGQNGESRSLSMDEAVQMTYTNNPSISAAQSKLEAAKHLKKAAWGLGAPKLSAAAEYTYMSQDIGALDFNGAKDVAIGVISQLPLPLPPQILEGLKALDLSYTLQKRDFGMVGVNLMVPIFTGGKINAVNRAAKIQVAGAQNSIEEIEADLFTELTERYWGLALARDVQILREDVVKAMQLHADNATKLEQNGIIARGELLFAEMALSQAKAALIEAQGNTKTINTALCATLGQNQEFATTTPMFVNHNIPNLEYFQNQTASNSHILEKVELLKRLSEELVKIERADFFPAIGAMGGANLWSYNLTNQIPRWIVGAGVKWTLFDGLTREHKHAAAKHNVRAVEAMQQKAQTDIKTLVEKLYYTVQSAKAQFEATASNIEFAKEYLRMKKDAFTEGMATSKDVVDAQLNLSKSQTERMAAAYLFDTTLAQLMAVAGVSSQYAVYQNNPNNTIIEN